MIISNGMQFVLFPEPITGVAPKVKDNEVGSIKKVSPSNEIVPLICAAQGFPSPLFRYFIYLQSCFLSFINSLIGAWTFSFVFYLFHISYRTYK